MHREDIAAGTLLTGLDFDGVADVVAARWIGRDALDVAYRVNGATRSRLLMRSNEARISTAGQPNQVAFDGMGRSSDLQLRRPASGLLICSILISPCMPRASSTPAPDNGRLRRSAAAFAIFAP